MKRSRSIPRVVPAAVAMTALLALTGGGGALAAVSPSSDPVSPRAFSALADAPGALSTSAPASGSQLQAAAQAAVDAGAAGYLARVDDGSRVRTATAGLGDRETGRRLKNKDQYQAGSQTKTFVAVLVLQLVAKGAVDLDEPIETYLPDVVPNGSNITVRMLLQHTSGLFNYTSDPAFIQAAIGDPYTPVTPQQLLDLAFSHDPNFAPGTGWSYSNTGYIVLGEMLKKVTGQPVGTLIRQRITKPLRLSATYLADPFVANTGAGFAHGYGIDLTTDPDAYVDISDWTLSWAGSAGALVSTARDLSVFYSALLSGKILPPAELEQMKTTVDVDDWGIPGAYGLGLMRIDTSCGTVWGHGGDTLGYHSNTAVTADGSRSSSTDTTSQVLEAAEDDPGLQAYTLAVDNADLTAVCAMTGRTAG